MFKSLARRGTAVSAAVTLTLLAGTSCSDSTSPAQSAAAATGVTGGDFHSLVSDPLTAGRLYVGGHTGVARSDDAGHTWSAIAVLDGADAMGWAIDSDAIWISGHPGIKVSFDGGVTFESRIDGLPDTDVHALGGGGGTLYAAGPGIGVAASADSGASWTTLTTDAGQTFFGRILVDPNDSDRLIAADVQLGAVTSIDGGVTWTSLGSEPAAWVSSGESFATIYASGGATPQRSRDGGVTWEPIVVPAGATLVEAGRNGTLYTGVHDGNAVTVWTSTDDGQTWTPA